jgi:hypothetical protein
VKAFEDTNPGLTGGLDASTIAADLLISTVLCTLLSRSRTEFSRYLAFLLSRRPSAFSHLL